MAPAQYDVSARGSNPATPTALRSPSIWDRVMNLFGSIPPAMGLGSANTGIISVAVNRTTGEIMSYGPYLKHFEGSPIVDIVQVHQAPFERRVGQLKKRMGILKGSTEHIDKRITVIRAPGKITRIGLRAIPVLGPLITAFEALGATPLADATIDGMGTVTP